MSGPAVSVIVCTFNRLHLLPRSLASVAAQTMGDVEVVVVNDGGLDPSSVVDRFRSQLDITLVNQPTNRGVTAAHNAGLQAARGRWIAWLDDDDRFLPNHLATLVDHASDGAVVPYTDGARVIEDAQGRPTSREVLPVPETFDRDRLLVENFIPALGPLAPRELTLDLGGFDETLPVLEDWDMWIRLSAHLPFVHVPEVTYEYRVRGGRSNLTTRATFKFHTALIDVYGKHPVPSQSWMAADRARLLDASAPRLEERVVERTFIVSSTGDVPGLVAGLRRIAAGAGDGSWEVVVAAPRTAEVSALAAKLGGPVTFVFDAGDAEAVGRFQAAGREVMWLGDVATADVSPVHAVS